MSHVRLLSEDSCRRWAYQYWIVRLNLNQVRLVIDSIFGVSGRNARESSAIVFPSGAIVNLRSAVFIAGGIGITPFTASCGKRRSTSRKE
jgi:hypothetical protein